MDGCNTFNVEPREVAAGLEQMVQAKRLQFVNLLKDYNNPLMRGRVLQAVVKGLQMDGVPLGMLFWFCIDEHFQASWMHKLVALCEAKG